MRKLWMPALVVLALVLLVIVVCIIALGLSGVLDDEESPEAMPTATTVPTSAPSPVPSPTATLPPTSTPTMKPAVPTPTMAPGPSPTPVPDLGAFSRDAIALLRLYDRLLDFKDDPEFHLYCYGVGGPYNTWVEEGQALEVDLATYSQTGIFFEDLWQMGWEYCQHQGQETEVTRAIKALMDREWLALMLPAW